MITLPNMVTCFVWRSAVSKCSTADYQCQFQSAALWIPSNKTACFNKIKFQMHRSHIRSILLWNMQWEPNVWEHLVSPYCLNGCTRQLAWTPKVCAKTPMTHVILAWSDSVPKEPLLNTWLQPPSGSINVQWGWGQVDCGTPWQSRLLGLTQICRVHASSSICCHQSKRGTASTKINW